MARKIEFEVRTPGKMVSGGGKSGNDGPLYSDPYVGRSTKTKEREEAAKAAAAAEAERQRQEAQKQERYALYQKNLMPDYSKIEAAIWRGMKENLRSAPETIGNAPVLEKPESNTANETAAYKPTVSAMAPGEGINSTTPSYYEKPNIGEPAAGSYADMAKKILEGMSEEEKAASEDYHEKLEEYNQTNEAYRQAKDEAAMSLALGEIGRMDMDTQGDFLAYVDAYNQERARRTDSSWLENFFNSKNASDAKKNLLGKYTEQEIEELREAWNWDQDRKATEAAIEAGKEAGSGSFLQSVGGNIASPFANLISAVAAAPTRITELGDRTGQFSTLNPYSPDQVPAAYAGTVRAETAKQIKGEDPGFIRKGLSYGYQGLMTAADSLLRTAVAGPSGGLALAGLGSFGSAVNDASQRGASPEQAMLYGTANAATEVLTEKIPLEDWLKIVKGGKQPFMAAAKNAFKQAGVEAATEELSFVAELFFDAAIMQEKSQYNLDVNAMIQSGMTPEEARTKANYGLLWDAFGTAMVSGFSGGGSALAGSTYAWLTDNGKNGLSEQTTPVQQEAQVQQAPGQQEQQTAQDFIQTTVDGLQGQETDGDAQVPGGLDQANIDQLGAQLERGELPGEIPPMQPLTEEQRQSLTDQVLGVDNGENRDVNTDTDNTSGIREQIRNNQEMLNEMEPVASIQTPKSFAQMDKNEKINWVIEKLRPTNYQVDREGFGIIQFAKKQLKSAFNYFKKGGIEEATFEAVPYVLKNGTEIASHPDHKGRDYSTVTFAAPVEINGQRGNMAVVVKQTQENLYKIHRILSPDGTVFQLSDETISEAQSTTTGVEPAETGTLASSIDYASMNSIPQADGNVNGNMGSTPQVDTGNVSTKGGQEGDRNLSAAEAGFTGKQGYYDLLTDENTQRDRAGDVRPVEVPKTDAQGKQVSEFVGNAYGSGMTSDAMANRIEELVRDNVLGYNRQSNEKTLLGARDYIYGSEETGKGKGLAATRAEITKAVEKGKFGSDDIAKAVILYEEYNSKKGAAALDNATEIFLDLQQMATKSGRDLQLFKLFRQLSPEGKFMTLEKEVQRTLEYGKKHGKITKDSEAVIPPELESTYKEAAETFINAESDQTRADAEARMNEAQNAIYQSAAAQMKSTMKAKWDAWRYMCMLGNPKTQVRNFAGNAAFIPYVEAKRAIGAGLEKLILDKNQRTKAVLNPMNEGDIALLDWAKADAKSGNVHDALEGSAKLGDTKKNTIEENVRVFDSDVLEKLREVTEFLPSAGDMIFKNREYSRSLAAFLKARGYSAEDIQNGKVSEDVLGEARSHAVNEAMRATFNDSNAFSDFLSSRYKGDNPFGKAMNFLAEGTMPFRKTTANIIVRAIENSPVGLVKGVWDAAVNVKKGKVTAATAIDQIAAGLTGSAAMALGFALANGIGSVRLTGGGQDDDEKRQGHQDYALECSYDGKLYSYTIDWAAPSNLPLFVGAELQNILAGKGANTSLSKFTAFLYSMQNLTEPMLNLSCMASLNDLVESAKYAEEGTAIYTLAATAATNYFTQGIPALLRQTEKAFQPEKKSTFANSSDPLVRNLQRTVAGIPFVGNVFKTDTRDTWGEKIGTGSAVLRAFDAFINPGYLKITESSALEDEINRLNDAQPDSVSPPSTPKTITYKDVNGEPHRDHRLTEEEYQVLTEAQGKTAASILDGLIESDAYKALSDTEKAKTFGYVYDYAREKGRAAALEGYEMSDSWMRDIGEGQEQSAILQKVTGSVFDDAFKALSENWKYGRDVSGSAADLDRAYEVFSGMEPDARDAFREENGGRIDYFLTAKENGVDAKAFVDLYKQYKDIGNSDRDTGDKANDWSTVLAKAQKDGTISREAEAALKETMDFRYSMTANTDHLDSLNDLGVDPEVSRFIVDTIDNLTGTGSIDKETGERKVTNADKYGAIAGMVGQNGLTTSDVDDIMKEWMPDYNPDADSPNKTELKYDYARQELGLSPSQYVEAWRINSEMDEVVLKPGEKRSTLKKEAWEEMGLSKEVAEALYKLYGGHDKEFNQKLVELYGGK